MEAFFIIGGIWFWILSIVVVGFLFWEIHWNRPIAGLITVGLYLGIIHIFGDASFPTLIKESPWILYIGIPAYVVIGVGWSIAKWALYVNKEAIRYKEQRQQFLKAEGLSADPDTTVPKALKRRWQVQQPAKPSARQCKWKIITWMCYWPLSVMWSILDEPWRYIYEALANVFQKISDKIYSRAGYEVINLNDVKFPDDSLSPEFDELPPAVPLEEKRADVKEGKGWEDL